MKELVLIELEGNRYGIWKDALSSACFDVPYIHGFPARNSFVAGVADHEGKMCTFYDLSASLGHGVYERKLPGRGVMLTGERRPVGLVFRREAGRAQIAPEDVLELPDFMATSEISTCTMVEGEPVLIIDIQALVERVSEGDNVPRRGMVPDNASGVNAPSPGMARMVLIGGEKYALPSDVVADAFSFVDADIHTVPYAPDRICGMVFRDRRALGIIDPSRLLGCEPEDEPGMVLSGRDAGWAFVVDDVLDEVNVPVGVIHELPTLAAGILRYALVIEDEVIPYLDPPQFMYNDTLVRTVETDFTLGSNVSVESGTGDVAVREFTIGDIHHVIPDEEIRKTLPSVSFRRVPGGGITVGVAAFDNGLLPVIDLAMCFGMRSPVGPDAQMAVYENGDLRALLLAGKWGEPVVVPKDELAPLPVTLPWPFVYGCATSEGTVRLIMNTAELAFHFVPGDEQIQLEDWESMSALADEEMHEEEPESLYAVVDEELLEEEPENQSPLMADEEVQEREPESVSAATDEEVEESESESVSATDPEEIQEQETANASAETGEEAQEEEPVSSSTEAYKEVREEEPEITSAVTEELIKEQESESVYIGADERIKEEPEISSAVSEEENHEEEPVSQYAAVDEPIQEAGPKSPSASVDEEEPENMSAVDAEEIQKEEPERSYAVAEEEIHEEETASTSAVIEEELQEEEPVSLSPAVDEEIGETEPENLSAVADEDVREEKPENESAQTPSVETFDEEENVEPETLEVEPPDVEPQRMEHSVGENDAEVSASEISSVPEEGYEEKIDNDIPEPDSLESDSDIARHKYTDNEELIHRPEPVQPMSSYERPAVGRKERSPWPYALVGLLAVLALVYIMTQISFHRAAPPAVAAKQPAPAPSNPVTKPAVMQEVKPQAEPEAKSAASPEVQPTANPDAKPVVNKKTKAEVKPVANQAIEVQKPETPEPAEQHLAIEVGTGDKRTVVKSVKPLGVPSVLQGAKQAIYYVVKKGDTLWDISARLTGDPFLFSTIAGDNHIENPDLIFPGQEITLRVAGPK